jgi:plastocyanin
MTPTRLATIGFAASLLVVSSTREALTQPAKTKPRGASQADVDRLERKVADQQQLLLKLIKLQQQYLASMVALMPDPSASAALPPPLAEPEPEPAKPASADARIEKTIAKPEAIRPAAPKKTTRGTGTIVGKLKGGGGDSYVYIEDISMTASGSATMKQEGKQFLPHVLVVQKGTKVEFPNRDAVFHNVFSVTPDSSFDLGSYRQGESKSVTLTKPGVVNVYCNMHPQMVGYILVVPSSLYARAGSDGFYRLPSVPSGKHRLVAWAPNSKPVVSEVDVSDDEVVTVELEVKRGQAGPHTNKDGMPYGSYKD